MCPKWAKVVKGFEKGMGYDNALFSSGEENYLDISHPDKCIVGEAHGFKSDYLSETSPNLSCRLCSNYSIGLSNVYVWKKRIPQFVKHWNAKHA
jgi:hypothetical protein